MDPGLLRVEGVGVAGVDGRDGPFGGHGADLGDFGWGSDLRRAAGGGAWGEGQAAGARVRAATHVHVRPPAVEGPPTAGTGAVGGPGGSN